MSAHVSDDIPRLLTGDATREETLAAAEHLRECPDCQQELVSAVVAHASLGAARRATPDLLVNGSADGDGARDASLPDLSAVFEHAHAEARSRRTRVSRRRMVLGAAAAALVLAAGGVTLAETVGSGSSAPAARTVALRPFGVGTAPASMTVRGNGRMHIDATKLPRLGARQTYEVWLTDPGRTRMVQVGFIGPDNRADLTVAPMVLAQYGDIEVSRQPAGQTVKYSGTSVLRGSYR